MMRKHLIYFLTLLSLTSPSQTKQDFQDFIKLHVEASPCLSNYSNSIVFGIQIHKHDAERFTGKSLSDEEYSNLIIFGNEVYFNSNKTSLFFEIVRICDLKGIRKISSIKKQGKEGEYYEIVIYPNDTAICTEWGSPTKVANPLSELAIPLKSDLETINKIKKAIIELAKLCGNTTIIDGDNLFKED